MFPFELLEEFIIGLFVCVLVSLLIFPLFATFDIENRINYCLYNFQQMHTIIIQAFLCREESNSKILLTRSMIFEQMIRKAMILVQTRLNEARFEPSQLLQRIFNRRRRQIIDLNIQEQNDLMSSLLLHVCSLQSMVKQCKFNEYHNNCVNELESSLINLNSSQTIIVSNLLPSSLINQEEFKNHLLNFHTNFDLLRSAYIKARLHQIENVFQSSKTTDSHDHLSHAFFLFQLGTIIRLLTEAMDKNTTTKERRKRRSLKEYLKPDLSRCLAALKSMIIIGVASIFVMVPEIANTFSNGLWILIAVCMSQGDTVGGAFTTMRMILIGTLLGKINLISIIQYRLYFIIGAMWAYVTYLSVGDDAYGTIGMIAPWIFFCGYMKIISSMGLYSYSCCFNSDYC